jgi:hypothetical protein
MNAGEMPGLTAMRPPVRKERLTITVVRMTSRMRGDGRKYVRTRGAVT